MTTFAALPPLSSTYAMAALLWLSLIAFAVLGGADFGAGLWDFFSFGAATEKERGALIRAIGPIWEANEIWLIFLITGLFTGFPLIFSTLSVALFIPFALALIGTVMRGAAFAYYSHFRRAALVRHGWGRTFSIFSVIAPFFFGVAAGTVATGRIHAPGGVVVIVHDLDFITIWLTPFALACGVYAVAMCALLAAVYMVVEANNTGDEELVAPFRRRAFIAYLITAFVGVMTAALAYFDAPYLWATLTSRALPLAFATVALGLVTVVLLWLRHYVLARIAVAGTVAGIFATWGLAQFPYLIPPDLTISNTASPPSVIGPLLVSTIIGMVLLLPSLWFLLTLFKARDLPAPHPSAESYMEQLPPAREPAEYAQARSLNLERTAAEATRSMRSKARRMHLGRRAMRIAGLVALAAGFGAGAALVRRWRDKRDLRSPATDM